MQLSEIRYIYWDGVRNVNPKTGAVDKSVTCWSYYREDAPIEPEARTAEILTVNSIPADLAKKDPKEQRRIISNCVVPSIKVRIAKADSWFAPVTDLLAIELRLRLIKRIQRLMLRVFDCQNVLVYQEVLDKAEILHLPKEDRSPKEPQNKKDARRNARADKPVST